MSSPPLVWRWCVAPAAVAAVLAASLRLGGYDVAALQATQRVTMGLPDTLWWLLTWLGDTQFALALLVLLVLLALPRSTPWLMALVWAALPTTVLVHGLKWAWHAPRPLAVLGPEGVHAIGTALLRNSFPSGHTAMAFLAAGCVVLALAPPRPRWAVPLLLMAALIGLSRVAVGAHWPSDVLAGAACGWVGAGIGVWATQRWPVGTGPRARRVFSALAMAVGVSLWWRPLGGVEHALALVLGAAAVAVGLRGWVARTPQGVGA